MLRKDIEKKLATVMCQVFKLPGESITPEATRKNLEQWDSLKHVNLMLALEDAFGVEFSDNEIATIDTFEVLVQTLQAKQS